MAIQSGIISSFSCIPPGSRNPSKSRSLAPLIKEISEKNNIKCTVLDGGRIIKLEKNESVKLIKDDVVFPINSSSSAAISQDAAVAFEIMKNEGIGCIKCGLFFNPLLSGTWTPEKGSWPGIHKYAQDAQEKKHEVICKSKGGSDVQHVKNGRELEQAVIKIFNCGKDAVIYSFKKFECIYQILVYNNHVELIFRKELPVVIGDGKQTLAQLISSYLDQMEDADKKQNLVKVISSDLLFSNSIPPIGEKIILNWNHNSDGTTSKLIGGGESYETYKGLKQDPQDPLLANLSEIALKTVGVIGLHLASVFIVKGNKLRVLEVNPTFRLDLQIRKEELHIEVLVYTKIIKDLFDLEISKRKKHLELPEIMTPAQPIEHKVPDLAQIISEITAQNGWTYSSYSRGWVSRVTAPNMLRPLFVYGYIFPNNLATDEICRDKINASAVLEDAGIPQILHQRVDILSPSATEYSGWSAAHAFAEKHSFKVVCKPAKGTGGDGVEFVKSPEELYYVISKLSKLNQDIAICRYEEFVSEYRLIMLNGKPQIIFRKDLLSLTGDGIQTMQELVTHFLNAMDPQKKEKLIKNINPEILVSNYKPESGKRVFLYWKHNLGQGATCEILGGESYYEIKKEEQQDDSKLPPGLVKLAKLAVKALGISFGSVDIAKIISKKENSAEELRIVEVNAGVMTDHLMRQIPQGIEMAALTYSKALRHAFEEVSSSAKIK